MKLNIKHSFIVILCALLGACSAPKDVLYLQGIDSVTQEELDKMSNNYSLRICEDDLLSINVTAWDPSVVTPFNPPVYAYASTQGEQPLFSSQSQYTYLVDKNGYIKFPVIGQLHVAGLTKQELSEKLEQEVSKYVKDPLVNVQLLNFKVTVLGDVSRPGTYSIKNDRVSIFELLGMAGDLSLTANRKNVLVLRDNNGKKERLRIDLTNPDVLASDCYYLKQNDLVYVEPIESKLKNINNSSKQFNISVISSVISSISVVASMIFSVITLSNNK